MQNLRLLGDISKIEKEGMKYGLSKEITRALLTKFWELKKRSPKSYVELVHEVLC